MVILLVDFAKSLELSSWDDMQVKHTWNSIPKNWESLGHPPAGSTIRLYIALKSERGSALIEALSEVSNPRHPRQVLLSSARAFIHVCRCTISDMAHTFLGTRLPSLSSPTQRRPSSLVPGLYITAYDPPLYQQHMGAPGLLSLMCSCPRPTNSLAHRTSFTVIPRRTRLYFARSATRSPRCCTHTFKLSRQRHTFPPRG